MASCSGAGPADSDVSARAGARAGPIPQPVSEPDSGWWLYGTRLESAVALPGLPPCDAPAPARRIAVSFLKRCPARRTGVAHYTSPREGADALEVRATLGDAHEFWFGDGTWARVSARGDAIDVHTPPSSTFEDSLSYLYGMLVGFALRVRDVLVLHASVVMLGERAVMFVGASGAGKSTLAATFALHGHQVITEDVAALTIDSRGVVVHRGHADVRLWPSAAALLGTPPLRQATPVWPKLVLPSPVADGDATLGRIYLLRAPDWEQREPCTTPLSRGDALLGLLPHTYVSHLLRRIDRPRELAALGALVKVVPVEWLAVPALPDGFGALLETFARAGGVSAVASRS